MAEEQNIPENKQTIIAQADDENNPEQENILTSQQTIPFSQTEPSIMEVHKLHIT